MKQRNIVDLKCNNTAEETQTVLLYEADENELVESVDKAKDVNVK